MSEKLLTPSGYLAASLASLLALTAAAPQAPAAPGAPPALSFLLGKRVVSTVHLQKAEAPAGPQKPGAGTTMVMAGPAEQIISRVLTVKKGKAPDEVVVGQTIQRVQMTILSLLGKSAYDSDNTFERDAVASALGQRYDPYVGKPRTGSYVAGRETSPAPPDPKFETVWTTNVPALAAPAAIQGILLAPLPATLAPGSTWTDSVRTSTALTVNKYRVLKKEGDRLQLNLTSQLVPGAGASQTSSSRGSTGTVSATSTVSAVSYEGEVRVRQASGFIDEMHLTKQASGTVSAAGQTLNNASQARVDVTNVLE